MPRIKAAKKALRSSKRQRQQNLYYKFALRKLIKKARAGRVDARALSSMLDKAAKVGVVHANKAARLKSRLLNPPAGGPKK